MYEVLQIEESEVDYDKPFSEYGQDSLLAVDLVNLLNDAFNSDMKTLVLFDSATVTGLTDYLEHTYDIIVQEKI